MAAEPRAAGTSHRLRAALIWAPVGAVLAAAWIFTAVRLWESSVVPDDLSLPNLDQQDFFTRSQIDKAADYERFLRIDFLLATVVLLVVLGLWAAKGERFTRESAAGRVGTGMLLGMLGFGIVWIAQLPFSIAALWWQRDHGISKQGYLEVITGSFLGLGGQFVFICIGIGIVMGLAAWLGNRWWILGGPVFVVLAAGFAFVQPYLLGNLHKPKPEIVLESRDLARKQGIDPVPVKVDKVKKYTTAANAMSVGIGPSRRVILWDTLLDGRFKPREVRVVLAHELGHVSRNHIAKGIGWFALFLIPAAILIALLTRRKGGMYRPEAVPLALFVLIALQVATTPLQNVVSRHVEGEADWVAFESARDPAAATSGFRRLATTSLSEPESPGWAHVLFDTHPSTMQRIEMVRAWQERERGR
jgi:Zn-dependent protease with chaperone function